MNPAERQKPLVVVIVSPAEACGRTVDRYDWLAPDGVIEHAWSEDETRRRIGAGTDIRFETPRATAVDAGVPLAHPRRRSGRLAPPSTARGA